MDRLTIRSMVGFVALTFAVLSGAPAAAAPPPDVAVAGMQTQPGQVRFYLTARNLPPGTALTKSTVSVSTGNEALPTQVEPISANKGGAPAVAAPQRGVVLVLDVSGSMEGAPLTAAREAANAYAAGLPADVALGLVTYADKPISVLPPTTDRGLFTNAVKGLVAKGATALFDGIRDGDRMLTAAGTAERRLVVLSDPCAWKPGSCRGEEHKSVAKSDDVMKDLAANRTTLDVVAFSSGAERVDTTEVAALAASTGGRLLPAADASALRGAFEDLAGAVYAPVMVTVQVPAALGGKSADLRVTVTGAGREVATVSTPVTFRADTTANVPLSEVGGGLLPLTLLYIGLGGIGAALLVGAFAVLYPMLGRSKLRGRLRQLESFGSDRSGAGGPHTEEGNAFVRAALAMSDKAVQRRDHRSRIEVALEQGAIALKPNEWILLRIAAALAGAALFKLMVPLLVAVILGAPVGWLAPEVYRRLRASKRAKKFADLLPESLQLMVSALRSGFSLAQSVDALVREGPDPVAGEFGRALAEIRLGGELEEALERTAARNKSRDLAWLVMAIRIQREVGGNLSEVMETAVETMRERGRVARHVRALSAEGRLSAYVLVGLPIALAAFMFAFRGEYLRPLYTEVLGLCMLGGGVALLALGIFWLSRVIKVKV